VDSDLLEEVDAYVASHANLTRGSVVNEALRLWTARRREQAIEAQYDDKLAEADEAEWASWRQIRREAAARLFRPE
jgi:Arc/MetJ-type ribon-helix-helix transcriptional regulator